MMLEKDTPDKQATHHGTQDWRRDSLKARDWKLEIANLKGESRGKGGADAA